MMLSPCALPAIGTYVTAECPARIDLQGGWSDTPPICYELGGSVVNIAILVDGKVSYLYMKVEYLYTQHLYNSVILRIKSF